MARPANIRYRAKRHLPQLLEQQRWCCHWCGHRIVSLSELRTTAGVMIQAASGRVRWIEGGIRYDVRRATIDHVLEIEKGGDNRNGNLVAACYQCNVSRSAKPRILPFGTCYGCGAACRGKSKRCDDCKMGFYCLPIKLGLVTRDDIRRFYLEMRRERGAKQKQQKAATETPAEALSSAAAGAADSDSTNS